MPWRKCRSASAFMSSGVARKTGECSHVQVSDEVIGRPSRWLADAAQRAEEKRAPARSFLALGQIDTTGAGKGHGRSTVGLRAEQGVVLVGPFGDWLEVVLVAQFAESKAPIVADGSGLFADVFVRGRADKESDRSRGACGIRCRKSRGPIGAVDFEAVAEDGVRRMVGEGIQQLVANRLQMAAMAARP